MSDRPPLFVRRLRSLWRRAFPARALPGEQPRGRAARAHGFVDGFAGGEIRGWAVDPDRPNRRVHVVALSEGQVIAEALANLLRPDLLQAGRGDGRHGFRLRLPPSLLDGEIRTVEVRAIAGGTPAPLKRGEVTVAAAQAESPSAGNARSEEAPARPAPVEEPAPALVLGLWPGEGQTAAAGWPGEVVRLGAGDVAGLAAAHTVVFACPGDSIAGATAEILARSRPLADVLTWDGADAPSRRAEARALGVRLGESLNGRFAIRGHVIALAGAPLLQALHAGDARAAELCLAARPELRWAHLPAPLVSGEPPGASPASTAPGPAAERLSLAIWPGWSAEAAASLESLLAGTPAAARVEVLVAADGADQARGIVAATGMAGRIAVHAVDPPAGDTPGGWLAALAAAASGEVAIVCQAGVRLAEGPGSLEQIAAWAGSAGVGAVTIPVAGGETVLAGLALKRTAEGWATVSAFSPGYEGRSRPVLAAPAAFLAIGRERLAMLGGPADARLPAGGADLDLGLRLRRLGLANVLLGQFRAETGADVRPAGPLDGAALAAFDAAELAAAADAYPAP